MMENQYVKLNSQNRNEILLIRWQSEIKTFNHSSEHGTPDFARVCPCNSRPFHLMLFTYIRIVCFLIFHLLATQSYHTHFADSFRMRVLSSLNRYFCDKVFKI